MTARKTDTSDSDTAGPARLLEPKLGNDEVMLGELLGVIDAARAPVLEARKMDDPVLSFERVRSSLREAYFMLNGEHSTLDRNTSLGNRRMLPYLIVHYGAHNLQRMALEVLDHGESAERALALLDRSRELTRAIQRHLFGDGPPPPGDVANVVDFATRKSQHRNAS